MKIVQFEVPGPVKGKGRPRLTRSGAPYTPKDTVQYENLVRICYQEQVGEYLDAAQLDMQIKAYYPIPKSTPKYKQEMMRSGLIRPAKKPDGDNIIKIICDSLNGAAYRDDALLVEQRIGKWYGEPRAEVTIWAYEEGERHDFGD